MRVTKDVVMMVAMVMLMVMVVTRPPNPVNNSILLLHLVAYAVHNLEDFTPLGLGEAVGACGWGGPLLHS